MNIDEYRDLDKVNLFKPETYKHLSPGLVQEMHRYESTFNYG